MCLSVFNLKLRSRLWFQVGVPDHFAFVLMQGVFLGLLFSTRSVVETGHLTCVHVLKLMQYLEATATEG